MTAELPAPPTEAVTLRTLLNALDSAVAEPVDTPAGDDIALSSVALVDAADLAMETRAHFPMQDVYLHVGVDEAEAVRWLEEAVHRPLAQRARVLMSKLARESAAMRKAAHHAGVALVAVHPKARWDQVFPRVQHILERSRGQGALPEDADLLAADTDLFGLAEIVAQDAGGLVSIEDPRSQVLAYSTSDESADELRTLSILGREGPQDYLRALRQWGVFDRLRETDEVIEVPAHKELRTQPRMVVSIREPSGNAAIAPRLLGSIWLQQGRSPFKLDAADVLRGASAIAARIISRDLDAPSAEARLIQRLFGARGGGVDVPSVAGALNLPVTGPAAVIGFAPTATETSSASTDLAGVAGMLRLHASAFRRDSVATVIGGRAYVLLPRYQSERDVTAWTRQMVGQAEAKRSIVLRAATAIPVPDLAQVATARAEVDRVLDGTADTFPQDRVTTLADSRTTVLLREILDLVGGRPELSDPRLDALLDYDREHSSNLRESVETYLAKHGDVRSAAAALQVHPNTLRYRIRRSQEIVGVDLTDAADRLLLELQLALRRHTR
ncbi:PucR family transcriptional regulator [Amycolatopsis lurida]